MSMFARFCSQCGGFVALETDVALLNAGFGIDIEEVSDLADKAVCQLFFQHTL